MNDGIANGMWRDKPGMSALHEWVKNRLTKPYICMGCNQDKPLDLANISQLYKRDLTDWEWLCRRCHMVKDGRLVRLGKLRIREKIELTCLVCESKFSVIPTRKHTAKFCGVSCKSISSRRAI